MVLRKKSLTLVKNGLITILKYIGLVLAKVILKHRFHLKYILLYLKYKKFLSIYSSTDIKIKTFFVIAVLRLRKYNAAPLIEEHQNYGLNASK